MLVSGHPASDVGKPRPNRPQQLVRILLDKLLNFLVLPGHAAWMHTVYIVIVYARVEWVVRVVESEPELGSCSTLQFSVFCGNQRYPSIPSSSEISRFGKSQELAEKLVEIF